MNYVIEESLMKKVFLLLNTEGYFNSNAYIINVLFEETDKFSIKIKRPEHNKREFIIKYPHENIDRDFYKKLESYLKFEFNFDLWLYAYKNDLSTIGAYTLFSILHEFGHIIGYLDRINNGGDFINRDEMIELSKYWEVSKIKNLHERFSAYRKIDNEYIADNNALKIMKKYRNEFSLII